jgi:hypothetical protein
MSFLLKNFWASFSMLLLTYNLSLITGYFLINKCFRQWFLAKVSDDYRFHLIQDSVKSNPKTTALMVWSVLVPETLKMAVLCLTGLGFWEYWIPSIPMYI